MAIEGPETWHMPSFFGIVADDMKSKPRSPPTSTVMVAFIMLGVSSETLVVWMLDDLWPDPLTLGGV